MAKSLLVKFLCDRGSGWSFATAASVTGYAYVADIIFGLVILTLIYPLLPSLTLNLSEVDAMQALASFRAQALQIQLTFTIPVGFIGILWKSYLGGLGTKFGTREHCSLRWGIVVFIALSLFGWLISFLLKGTV